MYFKNNSSFQCGLRTRKEVLTINPGEVISILEKDIIDLNSKLTKITEEEYIKIKRTAEKSSNKSDSKELKSKETKSKPDKDIKKSKTTEKEIKVIESKSEKSVIENEPIKENKEVNSESELDKLEKELETLKTKWMNTSRASKKAELQKEIKSIQEKIAKLK